MNVGVFTMKPFAGDYLVKPFTEISRSIVKNPEITYPQAALRYILNSGIDADSTLCGMYSLKHLYDDIIPFYQPEMSDEEHKLLKDLRRAVVYNASARLPSHYRWLENWAT